MSKRITIELTNDEALVLEGMVARFDEEDKLTLRHTAEYVAVMRVFGQIEKALTEPFQADYMALLEAARSRLAEGYEGKPPGVE